MDTRAEELRLAVLYGTTLPSARLGVMAPEFASSRYSREDVYMRTRSGRKVYHFNPRSDDIVIEDIAHHLSLICRFNGATPHLYSVAQHSVYVAHLVSNIVSRDSYDKKTQRQIILTALMHDAAEAYVADLHSGFKKELGSYSQVTEQFERVIAEKFGLIYPEPEEVKWADGVMLSTELVVLLGGLPHVHQPLEGVDRIPCWSAFKAKDKFLQEYYQLKE